MSWIGFGGPRPIHQTGCRTKKCGGEFTCDGCSRVVGWCMGAGDDLGEEHCDDCYCDRLAVLERCAEGRVNTKALLAAYDTPDVCKRPMVTVARELCEDGFLDFRRNGRFVLTARGRAEVSTPTAGGRAPEVRS